MARLDPSPSPPAPGTLSDVLRQLFPTGIPSLWCPPITHYDARGGIDRLRTAAHLRHLSASIGGILVPGSTGDGWELSDKETLALLEIVLQEARQHDLKVLVGLLRPEFGAVNRLADQVVARFAPQGSAGELKAAGITGFTVCPPRGADATQGQIETALCTFLDRGFPTALYQLPQVTQNEMAAPLVAKLVSRYPNLLLLKDTSGHDRVALSGVDLAGLFLVRGAEGDYARWLKATGGPYHGFLLSSANSFARELQRILALLESGDRQAATDLSGRVTRTVAEAFRIVGGLSAGNPFANANKAMDHFFAHGTEALSLPGPRLHSSTHIPSEIIHAVRDALEQNAFLPEVGYLK